jgi:hypothetical protein
MPTNFTTYDKYQKQRKLLMEQYLLNVKGKKKPLDPKPIVTALSVAIVLVACLIMADNFNCHLQGLANYCY